MGAFLGGIMGRMRAHHLSGSNETERGGEGDEVDETGRSYGRETRLPFGHARHPSARRARYEKGATKSSERSTTIPRVTRSSS